MATRRQGKYQNKYNAAQADKGIVKVTIRIPELDRAEILAIAQEMREEHAEKHAA